MQRGLDVSYPLIVLVMTVLSLAWACVAAKPRYEEHVYFLGQLAILGVALLAIRLLP